MYIERRVKQVHEQPEKSPRGRNTAAGGEGDWHNGPGPFAVRVRKEQPNARTDARDLRPLRRDGGQAAYPGRMELSPHMPHDAQGQAQGGKRNGYPEDHVTRHRAPCKPHPRAMRGGRADACAMAGDLRRHLREEGATTKFAELCTAYLMWCPYIIGWLLVLAIGEYIADKLDARAEKKDSALRDGSPNKAHEKNISITK